MGAACCLLLLLLALHEEKAGRQAGRQAGSMADEAVPANRKPPQPRLVADNQRHNTTTLGVSLIPSDISLITSEVSLISSDTSHKHHVVSLILMCRRYLAGISILFHEQLLRRPCYCSQSFQHMMSSKSAQDEHTTESSAGGEDSSRLWYDASITHLSQLTPTVTGVTINVNMFCPMLTSDQGVTWQSVQPSKPFNFLPGQWVDFYIPAINKVGGYSITSLPSHLPRLELAVKRSRHPPAEWVTSNAKVGDAVKVRVGGQFVYSTAPKDSKALLFIAGGVGINPLYGMLRQLHSDLRKREQGTQGSKAILLYSASKADELLFEPELDAMAKEFSTNFRMVYHVTKNEEKGSDGESSRTYRRGRVTSEEIGEALQWATSEHHNETDAPSNENEEGKSISSVYICGPTGFAEDMCEACKEHGVPRSAIHFEQWW